MSDLNFVVPTIQKDTQNLRVPCDVYSRVVGYIRPVSAWNDGKKQEFSDRKTFKVEKKDES